MEEAACSPPELSWQVYNTALLGAQWQEYVGPWLQRYIYGFMTFGQLVVLMNLLICITTDTFTYVKAVATVEFYRNLAQLIYQIDDLMTLSERRITSNFPEYLLYSTKDVMFFQEDREWEAQHQRHTTVESVMQAQTDLKSVKRQQDQIMEALEKFGDGSVMEGDSMMSPWHQFHL